MGEKDEKHERDDEVESDTETGEDPLSWGPDDEITFRFDMPLHVDVHGMLADAAQSLTAGAAEIAAQATRSTDCGWSDEREFKVDVDVAGRTAKEVNEKLEAAVKSAEQQAVDAILAKNSCPRPCRVRRSKRRLSKNLIWGRCSELITDPDANPPYGLPPYRHYICAKYKAKYKVTVKCVLTVG